MANNAMNNETARAMLFAQSYRQSQEVSPQPVSLGGTNTIDLPHAGIGLHARVFVKGTLKRVDGATPGTATIKNFAPYALVRNVLFKDYTGITRINSTGWLLHLREVLQKQNYDSGNISDYLQTYSDMIYSFSIPTASANQTKTAPFNFSIDLPISLNNNTTVGTYPFTVPTGNSTVYIEFGDIADIIAVTTGTTITLEDLTLYVTYYYLEPIRGAVLPMQDFSLVHELAQVKQTDNLNPNAEKRYTLDTGRTYYMIIAQMVDNGDPDLTNINRVKFLVNGATPVMDEYIHSYLMRTRQEYSRDLPNGVIVYNFYEKPWTPDAYGSLQLALDLGSGFSGGGDTNITILKESLYIASLG